MNTKRFFRTVAAALLLLATGTVAAFESKVYVSSSASGIDVIQRMDLDGGNVEDLINGELATHMDVDPIGEHVYWLAPGAIAGRFVLRRSELDGSNPTTVWAEDTYRTFRIDHHNGKVYYTKNAADRIWRANLDGSVREPLVSHLDASPAPQVRGFAIDIKNDRLYWTHDVPATIQYTNLTGTDPVVTVTTGGSSTQGGIDVDPAGEKIYWQDGAGIWSADLDVGNETLIIPPPAGQGGSGNNNLRLDHANGDLYWTRQDNGKIWRCELASCTPEQIGTLTDARSLALLLPCYDPIQVDGDGDGEFDLCDNCPAQANAGQGDLDDDHEGDFCDVDDGEISLWFGVPSGSDDVLHWDAEFGPFWNVYRSDLETIKTTGVYTQVPGSHPAADRFCDLMVATHTDGYVPGSGEVATFLVTGFDGGLETDLGTIGTPRPNDNPCP